VLPCPRWASTACAARVSALGRLGLLERLEGGVVGSTGDGGVLWLGVDRLGKRGEGFGNEEFASGSLSPSIPN
jgi:hypothetical protein